MQTYRPPFRALEPRTLTFHRIIGPMPVSSRQNPSVPTTLVHYFAIATETFGADENRRTSRCSLATNKLKKADFHVQAQWLLLSLERNHLLVVRRRPQRLCPLARI